MAGRYSKPPTYYLCWRSSTRILCFCKRYPCIGVLPAGSSGKIISLLSGGIDSPVASYKMIARGCRIAYVHFYNEQADVTESKK